jgi:lipoic acid synthetase
METLIPDFKGEKKNIDRLLAVAPEIISHNMETVKRLTRKVRIQARYERSLELLAYMKEQGQKRTKTGIMLGLGETENEVLEAMRDLREAKVDILTLGQYLQPTRKHLPVAEFIAPEQFERLKEEGLVMGFKYVESGPLVRSSYHAEKHLF